MQIGTEKKLPVGIDQFDKVRRGGFYYIDKTAFIRDLLDSWGEVTLFTRPRRFGKTLNMDMLKSFFEVGTNTALFDGLFITGEKELCSQYMGKFPVISISLKSADAPDFEGALKKISIILRKEARRFQFLLDSDRLSEIDKMSLQPFFQQEISMESQQECLMLLSEMLCRHYRKNVIILLDEYDVPLEKAYQNGYYDEMSAHIRSMFEMALKSNEALYFAVVTGCLRISKESIFTGLNNFKVHTLSDVQYDEYFGFTDAEVRRLLADYDMTEKYSEVKEWYNGYRFGQEDIYCPWDVLNYVSDHLADPDVEPKLYWVNSSGNAAVRDIIEHSSGTVKSQIEELIAGGIIEQEIIQEMTYHDLDADDGNEKIRYLWSLLYNTGYLTSSGRPEGRIKNLVIPNREIAAIFEQQIIRWFDRVIKSDKKRLERFTAAVKDGDASGMEECFNNFLRESISVRDSAARKGRKESFYHGILLGMLSVNDEWVIRSNTETGSGYSDILVEMPRERMGCIFEVKYAESGPLDAACGDALAQIHEKDYAEKLRRDGMKEIHLYAVACRLKESRIVYERGEEAENRNKETNPMMQM